MTIKNIGKAQIILGAVFLILAIYFFIYAQMFYTSENQTANHLYLTNTTFAVDAHILNSIILTALPILIISTLILVALSVLLITQGLSKLSR